MQPRGIFITGTGTGVGKTVVCAAVVSILRKGGVDAVPMKPVQTGGVVSGARRSAPDLDFVLAMSALAPQLEDRECMAPYVFEPACSPHLAARKAGTTISMQVIERCCISLQTRHEWVVVEGAGGILVPFDGGTTMLDLMRRLALPVVLVSAPALGTINHTLLSLRELERGGIPVAGIVFSDTGAGPWSEIESDNVATVERLGGIPVLGVLPMISEVAGGSASPDVFYERVSSHLPSAAEFMARVHCPGEGTPGAAGVERAK